MMEKIGYIHIIPIKKALVSARQVTAENSYVSGMRLKNDVCPRRGFRQDCSSLCVHIQWFPLGGLLNLPTPNSKACFKEVSIPRGIAQCKLSYTMPGQGFTLNNVPQGEWSKSTFEWCITSQSVVSVLGLN